MSRKNGVRHGKALKGRRVLVVEDEPLIAMELEAMLEDEGAEVVGPAHSLEEGLKLARLPLSAALLDIQVGPDMSERIAQTLSDRGVAFAFYTGQAEYGALERQWPDVSIVAKPAPSRRLVRLIEGLCSSQPPRRHH